MFRNVERHSLKVHFYPDDGSLNIEGSTTLDELKEVIERLEKLWTEEKKGQADKL